jgi:hypothetical protein
MQNAWERNVYNVLLEKPGGKDHLEDLRTDGQINSYT